MLDYALFSSAEYCIRIPLVCYLCNTILAAVFAVFSLIHYTLSQLSILASRRSSLASHPLCRLSERSAVAGSLQPLLTHIAFLSRTSSSCSLAVTRLVLAYSVFPVHWFLPAPLIFRLGALSASVLLLMWTVSGRLVNVFSRMLGNHTHNIIVASTLTEVLDAKMATLVAFVTFMHFLDIFLEAMSTVKTTLSSLLSSAGRIKPAVHPSKERTQESFLGCSTIFVMNCVDTLILAFLHMVFNL